MKKLVLFFTILLSSAWIIGCDVVSPWGAAGAAINFYIAWKDGEATKYYPYNEEIVYRAVKRSMSKMDMKIIKDEPYKKGGNYITSGEKDRFKIKVVPVKKDLCKLLVRINFMGDKPYAELLYKKVDAQLNCIEYDVRGKPRSVK